MPKSESNQHRRKGLAEAECIRLGGRDSRERGGKASGMAQRLRKLK